MKPSSALQTAPWTPGILGACRTKDVLDKTPCVTDKVSRACWGIVINIAGLQNGLDGGSGSRGAPPWPLEQGQWNQSKAWSAHVWFLKRLLLTEMRSDVNWADAHVLLFWTKTEHVSLLCPLWENLLRECVEHQPWRSSVTQDQRGRGASGTFAPEAEYSRGQGELRDPYLTAWAGFSVPADLKTGCLFT